MMKNALILHGTDFEKTRSQKHNNWFPWLKENLEKKGFDVFLPELPQAWAPDIDRYYQAVSSFCFNKHSVLVGHSSGAAAILGILNKLKRKEKVKKAILVAGFYRDEGWNCQGLFKYKFDWKKIRNMSKNIYIIWSPDDPYISKDQTKHLSEKLETKIITIPDSGHFNLEKNERFKKFPYLFKLI